MNADLVYDVPFTAAVESERADQRDRWGDAHDDEHTPAEWGLLILRYSGRLGERLEQALPGSFDDDDIDFCLEVKAAAVVLGAVCGALSDRMDRRIAELEAREAQ
jgi:hypothetical protein